MKTAVNFFIEAIHSDCVSKRKSFKILVNMLESTNMTDAELDDAISNHLKKLDDLEVIDNADRKSKLSSSELGNPKDLYYMDYTGDWSGNPRTLPDGHFNTAAGISEWKCKTPYSMSNPNHSAKCNVLYPNTCSDSFTQKRKMHSVDESDEGQLSLLNRMRRQLATYQEKQGIPKADYPFSALIRVMGQFTGKSLLALFYIIINIAPMAQIFLFIMRFILDKIISIRKTRDRQQMALKTIFLSGQLSCVYICLTFIIGLIWMPILNMIIRIITCCTINPSNE